MVTKATDGTYRVRTLKRRMEVFEQQLGYLNKWCEENQDLGSKITKWISEKFDDTSRTTDLTTLKLITQYHIEISKIQYASIALLSKVYRQKERFDKLHDDIKQMSEEYAYLYRKDEELTDYDKDTEEELPRVSLKNFPTNERTY